MPVRKTRESTESNKLLKTNNPPPWAHNMKTFTDWQTNETGTTLHHLFGCRSSVSVWMAFQESLTVPLLVSLGLSFLCQLQKLERTLSQRVKFPRWQMWRANRLEVKGKKKIVSHLINGLNLISGEKLKSDSLWLGQAPGPFLQNGYKEKGQLSWRLTFWRRLLAGLIWV